MIGKHFYILAIDGDEYHYLGKTKDLSFKTDKDIVADCDDGTEYVGSEKLSVNMTILSKVSNPLPMPEFLFVPVVPYRNDVDLPEYPSAIRIRVMADDYTLENKSGDLEKSVLSISKKYSVEGALPYDIIDDFFSNYLVIIGNDGEVDGLNAEVEYYDGIGYSLPVNQTARIVRKAFAFELFARQNIDYIEITHQAYPSYHLVIDDLFEKSGVLYLNLTHLV